MSRAPYSIPKAETAYSFGNLTAWDTTLGWRYPNPNIREQFGTESMGETAENIARERPHLTRERQDAFAVRSHQRAVAAIDSGRFAEEIIPVMVPQSKGPAKPVTTDERPRRDTTMEALARLKPAFRAEGGTVTAGNSSGLNDGAAALLVMSDARARTLGLKPMARVVASAAAGVPPRVMGYGPVPATRKALERAHLGIEAIGLIELNEAFAVQSLAVIEDLGLDRETCQRQRGCHRAWASAGMFRSPDPHHTPTRNETTRSSREKTVLWPGDAVRGCWAGGSDDRRVSGVGALLLPMVHEPESGRGRGQLNRTSRGFVAAAATCVLIACTPALTATRELGVETASPPTPAVAQIDAPVVHDPTIVSIRMFDEASGWAVSQERILRTSDGGVSWHDVSPEAGATFGYAACSYFLDNLHAWVLVPNSDDMLRGVLYRSDDGGLTWNELTCAIWWRQHAVPRRQARLDDGCLGGRGWLHGRERLSDGRRRGKLDADLH